MFNAPIDDLELFSDEEGEGEGGGEGKPAEEKDAGEGEGAGEGAGEGEGEKLRWTKDGAGADDGNGKGKEGERAGAGHSPMGGQLSVEPEAFNDVPMAPTAHVRALGQIMDGSESKGRDRLSSDTLPSLGRLVFELRKLLDNTSIDLHQKHLTSGKLGRNWSAIARGADDVFELRRTADGIDSAVMVALDQSGSMKYCMREAAIAVQMIASALQRCPNVAWDVRGFSSGGSSIASNGAATPNEGTSYYVKADWIVYKAFDESAGAFKRRAGGVSVTRSSTPDVAALNDCLKKIAARPESRKVLIWVGDGDGYSKEAVNALQKKHHDVKVIGIGIGVDLNNYFKHNVRVNNASDLSRASFKAVIKAIAA